MATDTTVAHTILAQLGGRRFRTMTGATNFIAYPDSLVFELPRNHRKIFKVVVRLTPLDVYTMEFWQRNSVEPSEVAPNIFNEDLEEVFTRHTGLYTRL